MPWKDPEKIRAYKRRWRAANRLREREKARTYRAGRLEQARAYDSQWKRAKRVKDGDQVRAYDRAYFAARIEKRVARAARSRRWREAFPDRVKALMKKYWIEHREAFAIYRRTRAHLPHVLAQRRAYYAKNRERLAAYRLRWGLANHVRLIMYSFTRRARKQGSDGLGITPEQWQEMCAVVGHRCVYCDKRFPFEHLTRDHLTPIGEGAHDLHNILPACLPCNVRKGRGNVLRPVQPFLLTVAPGPQIKGREG